ncbi:RNA polymerase sigma factor [Sphingobacterium paucimobilis]|uniref:RNA polymerase sigma-70 region 2 domain-containing protein n=1 Tax=Sphingobacterium paucimobilis HER1398 TaxID=1346330 RepID=U2J9G9_9SPHI|nr:RNA polymerase sigma factor [Sphingobacterium paucimobilis]ERJ59318.1 hypothetical protein M472_11085 [Sphingobacterium paucimobilis HER1398]
MTNKDLNVQLLEYRSVLKNLAYKFTSDPEDIQDLIPETLLRALKYVDQFFNNPQIIPWLFVIMKNIYINQYRTKKYKFIYENQKATEYQNLGSHEPFTENTVERQLILKDINKALGCMSDENQEIFNTYIKGYKYRELSDMYCMPEGTIKSKIFTIRKQLQRQFA